MNLQQIRLFEAVVEEGTFTHAGEREGYTQSRVTQMMKALEDEVGFPVFVKTHHGVTLTKSGEILLPYIRKILSDVQRLEAEVDNLHGLQEGSLKIGTHISCSVCWLPEIMRTFQDRYPGISLAIMEGGQRQIIDDLRARRVDVGLISRPERDVDIRFLKLMEDPLVVVFPENDRLSTYEEIPPEALADRKFVMSDIQFDSDAGRELERLGLTNRVVLTLRNDTAITSMVRAGIGISILPKLVLEGIDMTGLAFSELTTHPVRTLGVGMLSEDDVFCKPFFHKIAK